MDLCEARASGVPPAAFAASRAWGFILGQGRDTNVFERFTDFASAWFELEGALRSEAEFGIPMVHVGYL